MDKCWKLLFREQVKTAEMNNTFPLSSQNMLIINQQCYLNRITLIILHKINSYYYIHTMDNITIEI